MIGAHFGASHSLSLLSPCRLGPFLPPKLLTLGGGELPSRDLPPPASGSGPGSWWLNTQEMLLEAPTRALSSWPRGVHWGSYSSP